MNIAIISSRYSSVLKHDTGRAVYSLAHGLADLGNKVTVYTYNSSRITKKFKDAKVTVISMGNISVNIKPFSLLYEDIDDWNVAVWDELEHEDTTQLILLFDWFGCDAARAHRKLYQSRIIGMVGVLANGRGGFGPFIEPIKLKDYKEQELVFLTECDELIAFNKCSYNEVKKLTKTHCSIVRLGVESQAMYNAPEQGRVLVVGRISRDKCLELVMRAVQDLNWVSLTICGAGKEGDYGKYLLGLAQRCDLNFKLEFVDVDPAVHYAHAEMVVCASIYDAFSYSVMDAFNMGVPVIGRYTSYQDIITPANGMLFQSVAELASCLTDMHNSAELRAQCINNGKQTVTDNYGYQDSITNLTKVLTQCGAQ